jgi:hypothetical protein
MGPTQLYHSVQTISQGFPRVRTSSTTTSQFSWTVAKHLKCKSAARPVVLRFRNIQHDTFVAPEPTKTTVSTSTTTTLVQHSFCSHGEIHTPEQPSPVSLSPVDPPTAWEEAAKDQLESDCPLLDLACLCHRALLGREADTRARMVTSRARLPVN